MQFHLWLLQLLRLETNQPPRYRYWYWYWYPVQVPGACKYVLGPYSSQTCEVPLLPGKLASSTGMLCCTFAFGSGGAIVPFLEGVATDYAPRPSSAVLFATTGTGNDE
jgi:hypothetical protein